MSQSIPGKPVFPALPRRSSRGSTHTTVAPGTAMWESLVGNPRGKASRESLESLDPREGKRDTAATAREESARACPHSKRGLTPLGDSRSTPRSMSALERNPQVPALSPHKVFGPSMDREESREAPEQLAWGLAFPEATRAGSLGPHRKSRAPAATRENTGCSPLQAR